MKTKQYNVYSLTELSPKAKEKALNKLREQACTGYPWYDAICENWQDKLTTMGFESAEIWFSGFCSQGDGACFDASVNPLTFCRLPTSRYSAKRKRYNHLARLFNADSLDIRFIIEKNSYANHYYHSNTRYIDLDAYSFDGSKHPLIAFALVELKKDLEEARKSASKEIYAELEGEYAYLTSDEALTEEAVNNDYEFDENGKRD